MRYFSHVHGRTGTLREGRFKACLVQDAAYLLQCYRYIELNPVRATRDLLWARAGKSGSEYQLNGAGKSGSEYQLNGECDRVFTLTPNIGFHVRFPV